MTESSSNTFLQLLTTDQVVFHTGDIELWKDSGLHRVTGHLSGVHQPAGRMSVSLGSASVHHRGALALLLLPLILFCWSIRLLI